MLPVAGIEVLNTRKTKISLPFSSKREFVHNVFAFYINNIIIDLCSMRDIVTYCIKKKHGIKLCN